MVQTRPAWAKVNLALDILGRREDGYHDMRMVMQTVSLCDIVMVEAEEGEGFYLDSGILHAPGTALTMEIQEPSDVGAIYQANINGFDVDKSLLTKDVAPEDIEKWGSGELAALHQIDWEACADPYFYEHRHLYPKACEETRQGEVFEEWIYYGTPKFSGKRLILKPGQKFLSKENGVYNIFIWISF